MRDGVMTLCQSLEVNRGSTLTVLEGPPEAQRHIDL